MAAQSPDATRLHVSTRDFPEADRTPFWREVFARQMCHLEFEPLSDGDLDVDATLLALPGLSVGWCLSGMAARWSRTSELVKDGDDAFALIIPLGNAITRSQRGQDVDAKPGEAIGILHSEPGSIQFRELNDIAVMVPRSMLAALVPDLEEASTRIISNDALRLLRLYLMAWRDGMDLMDPDVRRLAVNHVHDLLALALGPTREAAEVANTRGVRAARLKAAKADIQFNLTARDLSVASVARRQRISPRYLHRLFESEGVSFSEFVLAERLAHAHRLLVDPSCRQPISTIAYASGFGDLSHFNHAFRRRYGATPSDVRRQARTGNV
jgi:AraC-like DNA-binding protein